MNILLVAVNYNSYAALDKYLASIKTAFDKVKGECSLSVKIADNSLEKVTIDDAKYPGLNIATYLLDNKGYLGGAQYIINHCDVIHNFDVVIISNVDLTLSESFFEKLLNADINENTGWIAPQIYSELENRDRNPKIVARPSKIRIQLLYTMYRYPFLHRLYTHTLYKRKKFQKHSLGEIFAGHGSFIILTQNFLREYSQINYPVFLFGEESYLGELCRLKGLKVVYNPEIIVYDSEHVSTSKMKSSFYYKCNKEALSFILDNYYE